MVARKVRAAVLGVLGALALSGSASAEVFQTDAAKTPLPQPLTPMSSEWGLVAGWGWKLDTNVRYDQMGTDVQNQNLKFKDFYPTFEEGDAISLKGLFKWRQEAIDPVKDAKTAPGYFSPSCGFGGELLLMGGNCQVSFGWYNVEDPNSTTPPADDEIYELIPSSTPQLFGCVDQNGSPKTDGFCPLAWDNRGPQNLAVEAWKKIVFDSGEIKKNPKYKGKYVAFALKGNPALSCKANKFSMYNHNTKNSQGVPWVASLIYQSTVDPEGFYMAFEDLPMSTADWRESGGMYKNDGDFNDFVFYVSGISCQGGGQPCETGLVGACSVGRTDCATEGTTGMCRPIIAPGPELCDNVDNDCNGTVDEGEGLCPGSQVCDKGTCIEPCGTGEFRCDAGFTCKSGHCIENACADKVCEAGQACRNGICMNACDGVVCPVGQECQLGRCVDPCAAVTCSAGKVCERGLCVSDCSCRGCKDGLECGADGKCTDPQCVGVTCEPGFKCVAHECVDACAGVNCPNNGVCVAGNCQPGGAGGSSSGGGTDGVIDLPGGIDLGGATGSGANGAGANGNKPIVKDAGCACDIVGRSPAGSAALLLGALGVVLLGARRRKSAA